MRLALLSRAILGALLLAAGTAAAARAGSVPIAGVGGSFNVPVVSLKEARFARIVRQQHDFSCGSASVATLLSYHYEQPTGEAEVFARMFEAGDREKILEQGFSLLDMKIYLDGLGYRSDGFRVPLDKLNEARIPGIALINSHGYRHFVVVKGVTPDEVLVADPALGNRIVPRPEFEAMWNGILFVILTETEIAANHFNQPEAWLVRTRAPLGTALMHQGLASFTRTLPGLRRNYF